MTWSRHARPSGVCAVCKTWSERVELDHIVPRFEGGLHDLGNIQWLCPSCHYAKSLEENRRAQTGRKHSQATKDKIAAAHRGMVRSPEARANMSAAWHRRNG